MDLPRKPPTPPNPDDLDAKLGYPQKDTLKHSAKVTKRRAQLYGLDLSQFASSAGVPKFDVLAKAYQKWAKDHNCFNNDLVWQLYQDLRYKYRKKVKKIKMPAQPEQQHEKVMKSAFHAKSITTTSPTTAFSNIASNFKAAWSTPLPDMLKTKNIQPEKEIEPVVIEEIPHAKFADLKNMLIALWPHVQDRLALERAKWQKQYGKSSDDDE